ncbi:hypothetical protein [Symbiopectobacterium purcellii]|uniref:hypothetical protein n=1 Tax=Symbiopectobacterium purcellii TaxID=2871826 RepID=UPI003F83851B
MDTEVIFPNKENVIDDGCDYTALIIWGMNQNARAASRAPFVLPPAPIQVIPPKFKKTPIPRKRGTTRNAKTHTGTVIRADGQRTVKLRETPTTWVVGTGESYYKDSGSRSGGPTRARLLLDTIKPIEA